MEQKADTLLEIHDLSVSFRMYSGAFEQTDLQVISNLRLTVRQGEIVAVVGSSGSGKSLLASAILGLLPGNAQVNGHLHYNGEELTSEKQKKAERNADCPCATVGLIFRPAYEGRCADVRLRKSKRNKKEKGQGNIWQVRPSKRDGKALSVSALRRDGKTSACIDGAAYRCTPYNCR